jgi:hypothetical protein
MAASVREHPSPDAKVIIDEPGDPIVFQEFLQPARFGDCIKAAHTLGADIQMHVHHETWTITDWPDERLVEGQQSLLDTVRRKSTPELDEQRLRAVIRHNMGLHAETIGETPGYFANIHGCWALAASDPRVCQIQNEIALFHQEGIRADFSFPAGRRKCDPRLTVPFSIRPLTGERVYDDPHAHARPIGDYPFDWSRFFIWNSGRTRWFPSIDYKAEHVRASTTLEHVIDHLEHDAPVIGETCYLKTHAHSMDMAYLAKWTQSPLEWFWPILEQLYALAKDAGIAFDWSTASEVLRDFISSAAPPRSPARR